MSFRNNSLNRVRQDLMQYGPPSRGAIQKAQEDENRINIDDAEDEYTHLGPDIDDSRVARNEDQYTYLDDEPKPNLNKFLMKQKFEQEPYR